LAVERGNTSILVLPDKLLWKWISYDECWEVAKDVEIVDLIGSPGRALWRPWVLPHRQRKNVMKMYRGPAQSEWP